MGDTFFLIFSLTTACRKAISHFLAQDTSRKLNTYLVLQISEMTLLFTVYLTFNFFLLCTLANLDCLTTDFKFPNWILLFFLNLYIVYLLVTYIEFFLHTKSILCFFSSPKQKQCGATIIRLTCSTSTW